MSNETAREWLNRKTNLDTNVPRTIALEYGERCRAQGLGTCVWKYDDEDNVYDTQCDEQWFFQEGKRQENGVIYCHKCGRKVVEHEHE